MTDRRESIRVQAVAELERLGYRTLSPEQAMAQRGDEHGNVILEGILEQQLRKLNRIVYKGESYPFSNPNITAAIGALKQADYHSLNTASLGIQDLLTEGKSLTEIIRGNRQSHTLRFIDWDNWRNNTYHAAAGFTMAQEGGDGLLTMDLVLFANGIPLAAILTAPPEDENSLETAVRRMLDYQSERGIPRLFMYCQILAVTDLRRLQLATVGSSKEFWNPWREDIMGPALEGLLKPMRLIDWGAGFIWREGGEKKIARSRQYFAVRKILKRVKAFEPGGRRKGGLIQHPHGSGVSRLMALAALALGRNKNLGKPRIVLATDRLSLNQDTLRLFNQWELNPQKARSGRHLVSLLRSDSTTVIFSDIDKFHSAFNRWRKPIDAPDIFVLVDERHKSPFADTNRKMKRILSAACYIGFTSTPLAKEDKSRIREFGGFIDSYSLKEALIDQTIVPLLYEGRQNRAHSEENTVLAPADRVAEPTPLHRSSSLPIPMISRDIHRHYCESWRNTPMKAQLVVSSTMEALNYKQQFDRWGEPAVDILPPPKSSDSPDENRDIEQFRRQQIERYGGEMEYRQAVARQFQEGTHPELLITPLSPGTGLYAPPCDIIYIAAPLAGGTLLEVMARANRVRRGKDTGLVIDYSSSLGNLNRKPTQYRALANFDEADIEGALSSITSEVRRLPFKHAQLWGLFDQQDEAGDEDVLLRYLEQNEELWTRFLNRWAAFCNSLNICLASQKFYEETDEDTIAIYKHDREFFTRISRRYNRRDILRTSEPPTGFSQLLLPMIGNVLKQYIDNSAQRTTLASEIVSTALVIVRELRTVNWQQNQDLQNEMRNRIEDHLYLIKDEKGIDLSFEDMDRVMDGIIARARVHLAM